MHIYARSTRTAPHLGLLWPPSPVWMQGRGSRTPVSAGVGETARAVMVWAKVQKAQPWWSTCM